MMDKTQLLSKIKEWHKLRLNKQDRVELIHANCENGDLEELLRFNEELETSRNQPIVASPATDVANALRFVAMHGQNVRYSPERKMWLLWNGKYWEWDTGDIRIHKMAKETARSIYHEVAEETDDNKHKELERHARDTERQARLEAMITCAHSELPVYMAELDSDQMLLNVGNGTIDLRKIELRPHDRKDYITRVIPIDYDPASKAPVFEGFLSQIFNLDTELIGYVQKCYGMAITGSQREQVFFYEHGSGANGKTTLNGVILDVLGDYAGEIDPTSFMIDKNRKAGPDEAIASLYGKRMVVSTELADGGRVLDVGLVKRMTGGESLRFERKYEHGFNFKPTHKLFLVGNHEPVIKDTTPAMWRRLKRIPFNVQIPLDAQIKDLRERIIETEAGAVLAWLVKGCDRWQIDGLEEPAEVVNATSDYRQRQDLLHDFISEKVTTNPLMSVTSSDLYHVYKAWCETNDSIKPLGKQQFNERLREKGFKDIRGNHNRLEWINTGIIPEEKG